MPATKDNLPYRPCVGCMVLNHAGKVWVGERLDAHRGAWQMPQGGLDEGEEPEAAARRELYEETGMRDVSILDQTDDWLRYDLPDDLVGKAWKGRYRGQKQKWFLMRHHGPDSAIRLDVHTPEFSRWKWVDVHTLPELIIPFKRDLYRQLVERFAPLATPE